MTAQDTQARLEILRKTGDSDVQFLLDRIEDLEERMNLCPKCGEPCQEWSCKEALR